MLHHPLGQFGFGREGERVWNVGRASARQISAPVFGHIQVAIDEGMAQGRHVGEKDAHLAVLAPLRSPRNTAARRLPSGGRVWESRFHPARGPGKVTRPEQSRAGTRSGRPGRAVHRAHRRGGIRRAKASVACRRAWLVGRGKLSASRFCGGSHSGWLADRAGHAGGLRDAQNGDADADAAGSNSSATYQWSAGLARRALVW